MKSVLTQRVSAVLATALATAALATGTATADSGSSGTGSSSSGSSDLLGPWICGGSWDPVRHGCFPKVGDTN
ncbi:hypothetical protein ACWELJ_23160 [Nocardia sp. NPDC004582]